MISAQVVNVLCIIALLPAIIASQKGKNFATWWLYGVVLFPIALIHALVMSPSIEGHGQLELQSGEYLCPSCAEIVRNEATICRFCGRELPFRERISATSSIEFLIAQLQSPDNNIRNDAIIALAYRGAAAHEAHPALRALTKDPVLDIRRRAKWALETLGRQPTAPPVPLAPTITSFGARENGERL